jgi:DNA-binding response OmpR family regulator
MNETILVVDDDELVRSGLAMNLERAGFRVHAAANSREAFAVIGEHTVDLVLCDLVLGDENGMDVLRQLQSSHPELAVVIITGHGSVKNALDALKGGASDYIQKPADPEEVLHRIHMVLDAATLRRTLTDERRKAEDRKRMMHAQLIRTERMSSLGTLAEGAAQDLRGILGPVESLPDEVRKGLDPLHEAHGKLIELDDALRKASAVIRDLEAIGKTGPGRRSRVDLSALVREYLRGPDAQRLHRQYPKVKIETCLASGLPGLSGSAVQLRQMIANLVINGVESMSGGGVLRLITSTEQGESRLGRFGRRPDGECVVLRIEDTANRLSDEDIERMFEPFYVRSRLGRRQISGLGMTLVYRVVEDHGGQIEISGADAAGNVLEVALPIAGGDDQALELRADYSGRERILLVDDSEAQRSEATALLQEMGYEVIGAARCEEALAAIRKVQAERPGEMPFDLMVIDLVLGDALDGVETFRQALELAPGQRAVLASGFADIARIVEARKMGIRRCFQKP